MNEEKVKEAGAEAAIESRELLDISDLSRFEDESFDVVVCLGGPLSYVFDGASSALAGMARVLKPGGRVLVSVMSRLGTHRMALREILGAADALGNTAVESVFESGDLPPSLNKGHGMRMYRFAEFEALLNESGFEVVAASASNGLTIGADELGADPEQLAMVIRWEQGCLSLARCSGLGHPHHRRRCTSLAPTLKRPGWSSAHLGGRLRECSGTPERALDVSRSAGPAR